MSQSPWTVVTFTDLAANSVQFEPEVSMPAFTIQYGPRIQRTGTERAPDNESETHKAKRASPCGANPLIHMVRLAGIEPTTPWFVAKYSIQLSYSRT